MESDESDRRSTPAGTGNLDSGKERSGMRTVLLKNWVRISSEAEREPLPVGIGDGGGAGLAMPLLVRTIAMDV